MGDFENLVKILACPKCGGDLFYSTTLICSNCDSKYIVKDNIPVLLE